MRVSTLKAIAILFILLISTPGIAEERIPAQFVGDWTVAWPGEKGSREASLVLTESGGKWKILNPIRPNPCIGLEVPVSPESIAPDQVVLTLKFSDVLQGCKNGTITLKHSDSKGVTGNRGDVILTLSRR